MKSKNQIEKQLKKKTDPILIQTAILAKKNPAWIEIASILTGPRRKRKNINLSDLSKIEAKTVVVPGKILSQGEIEKKVKVAALNFSEKAKEKLLKAGCEVVLLKDEIQKNKDAKDVKILS
jgi:large subunit ribosomal protein L18e